MKGKSTSNKLVKPTTIKSVQSEYVEESNQQQKIVTRTVKRTNASVRKSEGHTYSSKNVIPYDISSETLGSQKNTENINETNYSSKDEEVEASSHISQNERNQLIEDAKAAANGGSEVSALELYKKSGRYWDMYPKTDWTYSMHSRDRVEIAPGVVAMPNMSRKTIHNLYRSSDVPDSRDYHKEINNQAFLTSSTYRSDSKVQNDLKFRHNNGYDDSYYLYEKSIYTLSYWRRWLKTIITTIFILPLNVFSHSLEVQTLWLAKLHILTSRIMLLDTWLLWKTHANNNKSTKLLALCLIPLLLLGGSWVLTNFDYIKGIYIDSTSNEIDKDIIPVLPFKQDEIITSSEKSNVGSPKADKEQAQITDDQLEYISNYIKEMLNNDNKMQSYSYNNREEIDILAKHLESTKENFLNIQQSSDKKLLNIINDLHSKNLQNNAYLTYQLNRCCRNSITNIEHYVKKILTNLLNDEEYLQQLGLNKYLHDNFVTKKDFESMLLVHTERFDKKYSDLIIENNKFLMNEVVNAIKLDLYRDIENQKLSTVDMDAQKISGEFISDEYVTKIVKKILAVYDADKTGLVDYAMEPMGGQILTTRCTENYKYGKAVVSILGVPLWYPVNSPRTIITPSINPGECWAFQNFPGFIVIQLSNTIEVQAFSMEHISKLLVPDGKIDSAPREFEVYGLQDANDRAPVKLGEYIYDYNGEPLQYFMVQYTGHTFAIIELRVISNHGNPNYTCLYRFRVHGKLHHEQT